MARWWSLHEDLHVATQALDELAWELHVATQVPAQLVGLAAACERRWKLGWRGLGSGPAGVLGEGLAGWPDKSLVVWPGKGLAATRYRPRQGSCRGSGGLPRQGSCRGSSSSNPHLILNMSSQRSACHHGGASRALAQRDVGDRGLKGGPLCWRRASCPAKDLAGAAEAAPARVLPGEPASSLCSLWSWPWRGSYYLGLWSYLGSPPLFCLV